LNQTGFWREIHKKPGFWGVLYKPGIRCICNSCCKKCDRPYSNPAR